MRLRVSADWLRQKIADDPDVETDAGASVARLDGAISPPEQANYAGEAVSSATQTVRAALGYLLRDLRLQSRLSVDVLAQQVDVDEEHIARLESDWSFSAPPRTLDRVARHFDLPIKQVALMAGAKKSVDGEVFAEALKFAASSGNLTILSDGERAAMNAFVRFLNERER